MATSETMRGRWVVTTPPRPPGPAGAHGRAPARTTELGELLRAKLAVPFRTPVFATDNLVTAVEWVSMGFQAFDRLEGKVYTNPLHFAKGVPHEEPRPRPLIAAVYKSR